MTLTAEQQKELAAFPAVLRSLLEAELAAGNSIVEVGHSFPAPPAGAYLKLANKVSTRPRASADGIDFYERNSSIYSGEFTDAKRFYFILEPPNPPPPELDVDAIRKAHEPKSDSWFSLGTRDLMAANPPDANDDSPERYRKLAEAALKAEAHFDSVAAIQQAIVTELKRGGSFATSHKEGGTKIFWRNGEFVRSDYGDYPDLKPFADEREFLKMLRQFCHWEVTRNAGKEQLSDFATWKLILRLLRKQ